MFTNNVSNNVGEYTIIGNGIVFIKDINWVYNRILKNCKTFVVTISIKTSTVETSTKFRIQLFDGNPKTLKYVGKEIIKPTENTSTASKSK